MRKKCQIPTLLTFISSPAGKKGIFGYDVQLFSACFAWLGSEWSGCG